MKKTGLRTVIVLILVGVLVLLPGCVVQAENPSAETPAVDDRNISEQPEQDVENEPGEQV